VNRTSTPATTPAGAYNVNTEPYTIGHTIVLESGRVNGSTAGAKSHVLRYQIVSRLGGIAEIRISPCCGTTRSSAGGHYYQNYIRLASTVTCTKCATHWAAPQEA
jgi:hypothetical protein